MITAHTGKLHERVKKRPLRRLLKMPVQADKPRRSVSPLHPRRRLFCVRLQKRNRNVLSVAQLPPRIGDPRWLQRAYVMHVEQQPIQPQDVMDTPVQLAQHLLIMKPKPRPPLGQRHKPTALALPRPRKLRGRVTIEPLKRLAPVMKPRVKTAVSAPPQRKGVHQVIQPGP